MHTSTLLAHTYNLSLQHVNSDNEVTHEKVGIMMAGERKERSDKKRAVAPYISSAAYEQVARIGYVCDLPLKAVGELLSRESLRSREILDVIKLNFRRDYIVDSYQYCLGQARNKPFRMEFKGEKQRLSMRFYNFEYERFAALAYALDCSIQMAVGYVIETALAKKKHYAFCIEQRYHSGLGSEKKGAAASYLPIS